MFQISASAERYRPCDELFARQKACFLFCCCCCFCFKSNKTVINADVNKKSTLHNTNGVNGNVTTQFSVVCSVKDERRPGLSKRFRSIRFFLPRRTTPLHYRDYWSWFIKNHGAQTVCSSACWIQTDAVCAQCRLGSFRLVILTIIALLFVCWYICFW